MPVIHHRRNSAGHPSCGQTGNTSVTEDWSSVTCQKCHTSEQGLAHHGAELQRTQEWARKTDEIVREKIQEVFDTARKVADENGYCSTYQEIESEIISRLGIAVKASVREYEVEVEEVISVRIVRTITVEAESAEDAEDKVADSSAAEERIPSSLLSVYVEDGYHDSTEVEVESASVSS